MSKPSNPSSSFIESQPVSLSAATTHQASGLNTADAPIELLELAYGPSSSHPQDHATHAISLKWHPKITPFRMINLLTTICLGTLKAVAVQRGSVNEPITLEWVSGVVVFLVLFHFGTYEGMPAHHIPRQLTWLFEPDCMDGVWWLISAIYPSFTRPNYISSEATSERGTVYIVTTYRLLVSATVFMFGMLKAGLTYSGVSTGANWMEWTLAVVITSVLYIIGLYENNTANLWPSFFGKDRAYIVRKGFSSSLKLIVVISSVATLFLRFIIGQPDVAPGIKFPFILRGFNTRTDIVLEAVFVFYYILGSFVFYISLGSLVEDYRENIPQTVHNFLGRVGATLVRFFRAPFRWLAHYAYVVRGILILLLILAFNFLWLFFTVGFIYYFHNPIWDPAMAFIYFLMIFSLFLLILFSFRIIWVIRRSLLVEIRYEMQLLGMFAIRRLGRLGGGRVHYAFTEFLAALDEPTA